MTFSEWVATYCNGMLLDGDTDNDRLVRLIARETWKATEAVTREELITQFNRVGVDIDAALHGRVNGESPIANRLKMIAAAAQPQWQPIETLPFSEDVLVWLYENGAVILGCRSRGEDEGWLWSRLYSAPSWSSTRKTWQASEAGIEDMTPTLWMPLPEPPEILDIRPALKGGASREF